MTAIEELGITFFFLVIGISAAVRLRLPPVVGLLLAGAIIGPNCLSLVNQSELINGFADIGATLLLFVIGIEFNLSKIMKFWVRAAFMTIFKLVIVFVAVYEISLLFGFGVIESIVLGALFSITSTTIFSKLIKEQVRMRSEEISLLYVVLILEDIIAVFILAFISSLPVTTNLDITQISFSVLKSVFVLLLAYLMVQKLVLRVFEHIMNMKTDDMFIFAAFTMAALFSLLATVVGLQPSIGAFLAGSLIGNLKKFEKIEKTILPFGLFFSSFFFLSLGMLVDPAAILGNIFLIFALVIISLIAKFASVSASIYSFEKTGKSAIVAGLTMLSVGEFSLLIAKEASKFVQFDIIGLTASAVFLTSLVSAVLLMKTNVIEKRIISLFSPTLRTKGRKVVGYLSKLFRETETNGKLFKRYANEGKSVAIALVVIITFNLIVFALARIVPALGILPVPEEYVSQGAFIIHLLSALILLILVFRAIDKILSQTFSIFTLPYQKNVQLGRKVFSNVRNIGFSLLIFFLIPFVVSLLRLPSIFNSISIIPLLFLFISLWVIFRNFCSALQSKQKWQQKQQFKSKFSHFRKGWLGFFA